MRGFTDISDGFLKNAPTVVALTHHRILTHESYADFAPGWVGQGTTIVGGFCEVGSAPIVKLARRLQEPTPPFIIADLRGAVP